ncbi:MAG: RecX family transcriptional regulator [Candidatus Omnitrophica bacterium]|nr:RecX family transcriptional regulator [Candidatus Omnitrophota bacterium]MDD5487477.1 RecX family transcriptional regulator [Candidatus Omnitrophota bacterium]
MCINDGVSSAKKDCLRFISIRPRSEHEMSEYLVKKEYSADVAEAVLVWLRKNGLVNDLKFSVEWIETRLRTNPKGMRALSEELSAKGIREDTIKKAFEARPEARDDHKVASIILKAKLRDLRGPKDQKFKARLYRVLISRGIDPYVSEEVIRAILSD